MIAKRLVAALFAIGLILGAVVIRDRVIEDDGGDADAAEQGDQGDASDVLVCATELRDVCRDALAEVDAELELRIAVAGATLDELSRSDGAPSWVTFDPFPQMVDELRRAGGADPIAHAETELAGSPLAAVVLSESTDELAGACGDPVDLVCLADQTALHPTFAPVETGIGTLGIAAAVSAFGNGNVDFDSTDLLLWARRLEGAGASALSGGTAIQTIQTRPTFAVAIGAEAELASAQVANFDVLYADPMTSVDVVLMLPDGVDPPDGLVDALRDRLLEGGWDAPDSNADNGLPEPGLILAIRDYWEDLS